MIENLILLVICIAIAIQTIIMLAIAGATITFLKEVLKVLAFDYHITPDPFESAEEEK